MHQLAKPDINEDDIAAVVEVLKSGQLACGPKVEEFEINVAKYVGSKHGIAVSSGTAALHLCLKALNLPEGSEVLVPSFTFVATVNAILYEKLVPVFVDIDPVTFNIDPKDCEKKINQLTRVIIGVDIFGYPAPWADLNDLAESHRLWLIDDACEALGSMYFGVKLGAYADMTTFAFYPNKQIVTGEGGMITTFSDRLAEKIKSLRNHGRDIDGKHSCLGYNYRMDEMSAALGNSQLKRIDEMALTRRRVATWYDQRLSDSKLLTVPVGIASPHVVNHFVYVVLLAEYGGVTGNLVDELESKGVPTRTYFFPVHRMRHVGRFPQCPPDLPVTNKIAGRTLALPFHTGMAEGDVDEVCRILIECLEDKIKPRGNKDYGPSVSC